MISGATCYRPTSIRCRRKDWKRILPMVLFALCLTAGIAALSPPLRVTLPPGITTQQDNHCVFSFPRRLTGEHVTPREENSLLFTVNTVYPLPKDYAQPNVLSLAIRCGDTVCLENAQLALAEDAIVPLRLLLSRAEDAGYPDLTVWLGALSREEVAARFATRLQACLCCMEVDAALQFAIAQMPLPGCGEHETGYAVDIAAVSGKGKAPLEETFSSTPAGKWLMENAWVEGFVFEPLPEDECHFRYVGKGWALALRCLNLTVPALVQMLHEKGCFTLYRSDGTPVLYACKYTASFICPTGWPYVAGPDNTGGTLAVCWNPEVYAWTDKSNELLPDTY